LIELTVILTSISNWSILLLWSTSGLWWPFGDQKHTQVLLFRCPWHCVQLGVLICMLEISKMYVLILPILKTQIMKEKKETLKLETW